MSGEYPFDAPAFAALKDASFNSAIARPHKTVFELPSGESVLVLCEWRANLGLAYVVRAPEPGVCIAYFSKISLPRPGRPVTEIPSDWKPIPIGEPVEYRPAQQTTEGWTLALAGAYAYAGTRDEPNVPAKYR